MGCATPTHEANTWAVLPITGASVSTRDEEQSKISAIEHWRAEFDNLSAISNFARFFFFNTNSGRKRQQDGVRECRDKSLVKGNSAERDSPHGAQ